MDKREKAFVELEMSRYEYYKKMISLERERILNASPKPPDGMPRGNATSNPTEQKAVKLLTNTAVLSMQMTIEAIDRVLKRSNALERQLFKLCYINGRKDYYRMCDDLHISYPTLRRYKSALIESVASELGILKTVSKS